MELLDKMVITEKREDAGSRSANRFAFQIYWALNKMIDLYESEEDFLLIMEYFDDIIVLDKSDNPEFIDFYQIKTNTSKSTMYISTSTLTAKSKKKKESFLEKMIDNYVRFRKEIKGIYFVSNKHYNMKLECGKDSRTLKKFGLNELEENEFKKIKKSICPVCKKVDCSEECRELVFFEVTDLAVTNYYYTVMGSFFDFINKYGVALVKDTNAAYLTLLSQLSLINNCEHEPRNIEDLLKMKSISKADLKEYIDNLSKSVLSKPEWNEISDALRAEGYKNMYLIKLRRQWNKYCIHMVDCSTETLAVIRKDIRDIIVNSEFSTIRELIEYAHLSLKDKDYYNKNIYEYEYFTAVLLMELYYEE